ncbi:hypothetical protein C8Q80DRAFT_1217024 [Daedaleopsis nitida]|nr:hypothetical protein C8Q80DRAFT_1217024 [Daedaleopsis nitida]
MSLVRAPLMLMHAVLYQLASTPPNKTPPARRYDSTESVLIRMAPLVFKVPHPPIRPLHRPPRSSMSPCPPSSASLIRPTVPFFTGLALVAAGTALRLACYRSLGPFFTFDLTLLPKHKLITSGPYNYVRHPAYAGSLLVLAGLGLTDLSPGGWIAECVSSGRPTGGVFTATALVGTVAWAWIAFAVWYAWWLSVGVRRARMEDAALRKEFRDQWDTYATRVRWWFVPGLL